MFNLEEASRPIIRPISRVGEKTRLTGISDEATAKAVFAGSLSTFADDAAVAAGSDMLKIRNEYQLQPALAQVGAADAYARDASAAVISTHSLGLGQGSQISVITNRRFDPSHPEFASSASNASFDTLSRFFVRVGSGVNIEDFISSYFNKDDDGLVQVYQDRYNAGTDAFATIPVPALNSMVFENISVGDYNGSQTIRNAFLAFMQGLLGGSRVGTPAEADSGDTYYIQVNNDGDYVEVGDGDGFRDLQHIGRVYTDTSNIASYQIIIENDAIFQNSTGTAQSGITDFTLASDAEMGVLALINGLLDPSRSTTQAILATNTHGIAPLARLNVFTSYTPNDSDFNAADLIYRARGIDLGAVTAIVLII